MFIFLFSVTVIPRHKHSHSSLLKLLHNNLDWARRVLESQHNNCRVAAQPSRWLAWLNCSKHNARCAHVSRFHKGSQPGHDSRSGHFAPSIATKPKSYGHSIGIVQGRKGACPKWFCRLSNRQTKQFFGMYLMVHASSVSNWWTILLLSCVN